MLTKEEIETYLCDYDGQELCKGDKVEVVEEYPPRKGKPEYEFCSKGKRGIVRELYYCGPGNVLVRFGKQSVGCWIKRLKKI